MKKIENVDIRVLVREKGITYRGIAKTMGVGANYLSRIMGKPLSQKNRQRILDAIKEMTGGKRLNE